MRAALLVLMAACSSRARHAEAPAPPTAPAPPAAAPAGPAPTGSLQDYVVAHGQMSDANGAFQLSLASAHGCAIEMLWTAAMNDGSRLRFASQFDLALAGAVSIYLDKETQKHCIKVETPSKTHMQVHLEMTGSPPTDTPLDDDTWGVCTEREDFLQGLATELERAIASCHH